MTTERETTSSLARLDAVETEVKKLRESIDTLQTGDIQDLRIKLHNIGKVSSRLAVVEAQLAESKRAVRQEIGGAIEEMARGRGALEHAITQLEASKNATNSSSRRGVIGQVIAGGLTLIVNALILLRPTTPMASPQAPVVVYVPSPLVSSSVAMTATPATPPAASSASPPQGTHVLRPLPPR